LSDTLQERPARPQISGLDLGEDFVLPEYNGGSILNLPDSLCRLFGIPDMGSGPLAANFMSTLEAGSGGGGLRVVMLIVDALAFRRLTMWMADGTAPIWRALSQDGFLAPLTSIVPSTTSAAMASLWTGKSTARHGVVGYEMWLKEYGVVANTVLHAPMSFRGDHGSLVKAGFDPQTFLGLPTLGTHLASHGVGTYSLHHYGIANSGLSQMLLKDVEVRGFSSPADLWINLRHLLAGNSRERLLAWVYWSEVDHSSHYYGPEDERTLAEFSLFSSAFGRYFLEKLDKTTRQRTVLILTADHGQIATPPDSNYDLRKHEGLIRRLHILPTGENRLAYLYIRPGQTEAVREYIDRRWTNQFVLLDPAYAVYAGLFGNGPPHPRLSDRLGDLIVAARGGAYWWWAEKDNYMHGRHGGLHPDEMLVPFLAVKLD